jgi:hypothetical protein
MNGLQAAGTWRMALTIALAIYVGTATLLARPPVVFPEAPTDICVVDQLSRRGVFEGPDDVDAAGPASADDLRISWLTFYLIYADEALSRYAPGGAMGARFDLFQFAGFSDAQPIGYPIHIVVTNRRTTLLGVVNTSDDRQLAEVRAREAPHVVSVTNALEVAP